MMYADFILMYVLNVVNLFYLREQQSLSPSKYKNAGFDVVDISRIQ